MTDGTIRPSHFILRSSHLSDLISGQFSGVCPGYCPCLFVLSLLPPLCFMIHAPDSCGWQNLMIFPTTSLAFRNNDICRPWIVCNNVDRLKRCESARAWVVS